MKLDSRRVSGFLRDPGSCRAVLLYGDDDGLVRERAEQLTKVAVGSLHDPFRIAELRRDTGEGLLEEAAALSLTGGRRVVRVREATDGLTPAVKSFLASRSESLIILEGTN